MTSIHIGNSIHSPNVKPLDTNSSQIARISKANEKIYKNATQATESGLATHRPQKPSLLNPANNLYATIEIDGKIVAKINNRGFVETTNAIGDKIQILFADEDSKLNGPALAKVRAAKIADLLGGKMVKYSSAITQAQFNTIHKSNPKADYQAILDAQNYEQLQKTKQAETLFLTQKIGQENSDGADFASSTPEQDNNPVKNFLDYMSMTPEERFYEALLKEEGLTQEQLEALPPEERAKIEEKIQRKAEERISQESKKTLATANKDAAMDTTRALEHYQVPEWMADHSIRPSGDLGSNITEKLGKNVPKHGSPADKAEYSTLIREHYETVLKEANIKTPDDHYDQLIQNKNRSEELHQRFKELIGSDERLKELEQRVLG